MQNAMPDPQMAYDNLFHGVHTRVFFQKCAAAGFSPRSEQEAMWMLDDEVDERLAGGDQPISAIDGIGAGAQSGHERRRDGPLHLGDERRLVREVPVDRWGGDACLTSDGPERECIEAVTVENAQRGG